MSQDAESELYMPEPLDEKCPKCGGDMLGNMVLHWCTKCSYYC
jgi:hypothetical protein